MSRRDVPAATSAVVALWMGTMVVLRPADASAGDRARVRVEETADVPIKVDLQMTYAYPPTISDVEEMEAIIQGANRVLCDATEGQLGLGTVWLTSGSAAEATADVFILPPGLWERASSNGFILHDTARVFLSQGGRDMETLAHELAHAMFRLGDEYGEQSRYGRYDGFGFAIEPGRCTITDDECWTDDHCIGIETCDGSDITDTNNTLMGPQLDKLHCGITNDECVSDLDCLAGDTCQPHPFYSEFSTDGNFDILQGDGSDCPEDRPGTVITLDGFLGEDLDSIAQDAAPSFDGSTWQDAMDTATAWTFVRFIDEAGVVIGADTESTFIDGYDSQSSHDIGLFFKHLDRSTREWELHVLIDNKHLDDPLNVLEPGEPSEIGTQLIDFNGGATTYPLTGVAAFAAQGTLLPIAVPELDQTGATWELDLDIGNIVLIAGTANSSLGRSEILTDTGLQQRGDCEASAAASDGALTEVWCDDICAEAYNTGTDRWESSNMTIDALLGAPDEELGDSEWDKIAKIDERYAPDPELGDEDPDAFHGQLVPPVAIQAEPHVACLDAISIETSIEGTDAIVFAIDVSGSMEDDLVQGGQSATRLQWAQGAARAIAVLTANHNDSAAASDEQMLGLVTFATTSAPVFDLQVVDSTNLDDLVDEIDDLSADGNTAVADGIVEAGELIDDATDLPKNPAIVVMTDGQANVCFGEAEHCDDSNTCTCGEDPPDDAVEKVEALEDDVTFYFVPLGAENGQGVFADAIQQASGEVFPAPSPLDLAIQYARAYLRISGISPIIDGSTWEVQPGSQSPPAVYQIPVETAAGGLTLLLTARNAEVEDWNPTWSLETPTATVYTHSAPGIVDVHDDPSGTYFRVLHVDAPGAGTWTLSLGAPVVAQQGALTAWTNQRLPSCSVSAVRGVVHDTTEDLEITVAARYGGPIDGVDYTVHVIRPDGSDPVPITMEPERREGGMAHGFFPAAEFHGRGTYVILAECDASNARIHPGEALDPDAAPLPATPSPAFQRAAAASFMVDVPGEGWIPDGGDCDDNGISDSCEGASCAPGSSSCEGDAVPCSSYGTQARCNAEPGCSWSPGACGGTRSCDDFTGQATCTSADGCTWQTHPCPPSGASVDTNGDGILDACDADNDGDDVPDTHEPPWCAAALESCPKVVCGGAVVGCCPGLQCHRTSKKCV